MSAHADEAKASGAPDTLAASDTPDTSEAPTAPGAQSSPGCPSAAALSAGDKLLTTGEMARMSSNTLRTVRFYEEEGILRPTKRTDGGHRLFDRAELDRLLFVTDLRVAGLSLDEIKEILQLKKSSASGEEAAREVRRILGERIRELETKLSVLTRLRDDFTQISNIVSACLGCRDNEIFPDGCSACSVMTSHVSLPRSARVVWSVGVDPPPAVFTKPPAKIVQVLGDAACDVATNPHGPLRGTNGVP